MALIRLLKFILKNLYIIIIVVALCGFIGFFAYDNTYLNILVRDGMTARAECKLGSYEEDEVIFKLNKLFSTDYVYNIYDNELTEFDDYKAETFRYNVTVGIPWVFPWDDKCEVLVEEKVAELSLKYTGLQMNPGEAPDWRDGVYKVLCEKKNGTWKITGVEYVGEIEEDEETEEAGFLFG